MSTPGVWRCILTLLRGCRLLCFLGKDFLCGCWGWEHGTTPSQTCSHFREAFRPKGANKPLFAGGDGEIHGEFNRTEFSPCKSFRDYNLFLHVSIFSPLKLLSQISPVRPLAPTLDSFWIIIAKSCSDSRQHLIFWLRIEGSLLLPICRHTGILPWFLLNCSAPKARGNSIIYRLQVIRWVSRNHSGFLFSEPKSQNSTNRLWQWTPRVGE